MTHIENNELHLRQLIVARDNRILAININLAANTHPV